MLLSPPNLITAIPCYVVRHNALINKLQRIQNSVARIITGHGRCEHIPPVLKSIQWLPVQKRIKFNTLALVYKAVNYLAPAYLQELLHTQVPRREFWSSETNLLVVPFICYSAMCFQCCWVPPMEQSSTEPQIGAKTFSF